MKILIAEDESVSRRMLEKTLEKWGYEFVSTNNGINALQAFKEERFEIVITDWMMPEMNGLELVKHIRENQSSDYVYIIMLTAKSEKEDLVIGMDTGADDFVAKPFDRDELRVRLRAGERIIQLEESLSQKNVDLQKANERMKLDLEAAAEIQKSLLPTSPPQLKGINIAWRFRPCDELAGDIFNIFNLDEDEIGFYVLDVSGHGVSAALLAVTLSRMLSPVLDQASLLKSHTKSPPGYYISKPAHVANQLNKRFQIDPNNGQFFTLLYGILNKTTNQLRYVSAGHPGIIYMSQTSEAELLRVRSMPIGFMEDAEYQQQVLQLSPGDRIFIYSDGIPEAENPQNELFGNEQMLTTLQDLAHLTIEDSLDQLLQNVEVWCKSPSLKDDATLLSIEISKAEAVVEKNATQTNAKNFI